MAVCPILNVHRCIWSGTCVPLHTPVSSIIINGLIYVNFIFWFFCAVLRHIVIKVWFYIVFL